MPEEQKINMNIADGNAFFAHELSINFNPTQFIFDFKNVTPRVDPRSREKASISLVHNVVMIDPYHARQIFNLLEKVIKKYEGEYGKIEKPESLKRFEKKHKNKAKSTTKTETPSYFG